ncbi:MAG: flippase-like domain-containing protein [Proteobacteria bacterium]|nr:flippase-like domain-containing protein [Pseudomonadota bacterium]
MSEPPLLPDPPAPLPGWRRLLSWLPALIVLPALVAVVWEHSSIERFIELAQGVQPEWLLPALAAQVATYVFAALSWRLVLHRVQQQRPFRTLFRLSVAKLYTDQAIPTGGVSGTLLVVKALTRRGVPSHAAMAALLVGMVSHYAADVAAALACLALLGLHDAASFPILALVVAFAAVEVAIPGAVLWGKRQANRSVVRALVQRLPGLPMILDAVAEAPDALLHSSSLVAGAFGCQIAIILLDSLTLWFMTHAIGIAVPFWVAFCSFTVGDMVAMLAPSPLGLGTFEAGTTGMLALLGMPLEAALSVTILLRGFTFWLPMLPGVLIARHEVSRL